MSAQLTTKHLFLVTALIALSLFIITFDKFASLLSYLGMCLGISAIIHAVSINFRSYSWKNTIPVSATLSFAAIHGLQRILPETYQNHGWIAQLTILGAVILICAIIYVLFARAMEGI